MADPHPPHQRPDAAPSTQARFNRLVEEARHDEAGACAQQAADAAHGASRGKWLARLGMVRAIQQRFDQAAAAYQSAQGLAELTVNDQFNFGLCCDRLGRLDQAVALYQAAAARAPHEARIFNNLGKSLNHLGRLDEAEQALRMALQLEPGRANSELNLAFNLLMRGQWAAAWPLFEARLRAYDVAPPMPYPRWTGRPDAQRILLLRAEQGLGDTIQFARFASLLGRAGQPVLLQVDRRMLALVKTLPSLLGVLSFDQAVGSSRHPIDWLPLMSAPGLLGVTPQTVPWPGAYLSADAERCARWQAWLPPGGLRIGIAWQGNPQGDVDLGRSFALARFAPLAAMAGVTLVALQIGTGLEQLGSVPFGAQVRVPGPDFDAGDSAFVDSAALIHELDLVITSDSALAHLAGALGRPVWLLLKRWPDWRWWPLAEQTAWYPSMRVFRQDIDGDWDGLFGRVAQALAEWQAARAVSG